MKYKYFLFNKPCEVLCQFTDKEGRKTLKDFFVFDDDIYHVGRLDYDSEGLLLLTNDKKLTDLLLNPKYLHEREYFALVEGIPNKQELSKLNNGILIEGKKTLPATARFLNDSPVPFERSKAIRKRKNIPTSWISLIIKEGRNRQVRKMTAAIGFPTLRLVRNRIASIELGSLLPGEVRELIPKEIDKLYSIIKKAPLKAPQN